MKMKNDQNVEVLNKDVKMGVDENTPIDQNSPEGTHIEAEAKPEERKVKLYWTKRLEDKAFTMSILKEGEVFKKTKSVHTVAFDGVDPITTPIYSLNRGRRSYYAIDLTEEETAASQLAEDNEAKERQGKIDQRKAEHKAELEKRAEERKAKRAGLQMAGPAEQTTSVAA